MEVTYLDAEIAALVKERKQVPANWSSRIRLLSKRGHKQRNLDLMGATGNKFQLILRQSGINVLDFSVILAVRVPNSNRLFRLRRYNGKSHEHSNRIEGERLYGFHIHMATERYQVFGYREDTYAELTERYADFRGAIDCLIEDANLVLHRNNQGTLFKEM